MNPILFYDIIIHIESINDITKGWKVEKSPRIFEKYDEFKKDKVVKIGVIGNSNKGKSFILSKISGIYLPFGTSLKTRGLSIKFPDLKIPQNKKLALLDSAGFETPVLSLEKQPKNENENEISNENIYKNLQKNIELFKKESRDKIITEYFLQNYIIHYSDILLLIVGILTYSEQKLLNKVKSELKRIKNNKILYVIHNLMTFTTKLQVKKYIEEVLLKSATFDLELQVSPFGESECYYEKGTDPVIKHLFFAYEGSEAGNYYNKYTLEYLEKDYNSIINLKEFDVLETVKERFKDISKEILEKNESFEIQNKIVFDDSKEDVIKLKQPQEIKLKKCLIDELGFQNYKSNGFEPSYNVIKTDKEIFIMVEAPGDSKIISAEVFRSQSYFIVRIIGNKSNEPVNEGSIIHNSRESGKFILEVPFKLEDFWLKNKASIHEGKKGMFIIKLELEK